MVQSDNIQAAELPSSYPVDITVLISSGYVTAQLGSVHTLSLTTSANTPTPSLKALQRADPHLHSAVLCHLQSAMIMREDDVIKM